MGDNLVNFLTIKEQRIIADFNNICKELKSASDFEDRFICLYERLNLNYSRLKRLFAEVSKIYDSRVQLGYTDIVLLLKSEDIKFISDCIKEHDEFSFKINSFLRVKSSYTKNTIKEKSSLYIMKILNYFYENGIFKTLEKIILIDKLELISLNGEYFDNLVFFALSNDDMRLKNSSFSLKEIFVLAKILLCYNVLINEVHLDNTCESLFGDDKERVLSLSKEARYLNGIKPAMLSSILYNRKLTQNQVMKNMNEYIPFYEKSEQEKLNIKREKLIVDLENELEKCSIVVKRFIDSRFKFLDQYFTINRIDQKRFNKALEVLKNHNHPTYQAYLDKVNAGKEQINFNLLLDGIINGVTLEDGSKRDFDLVDYYELTSISLNEAKGMANKDLPYSDYLMVSNFHKKYCNDSVVGDSGIKKLMEMSFIFIINNEQYTASSSDKMATLFYIEQNNIPLTQFTYKILLKRIIFDKFKQSKDSLNCLSYSVIINDEKCNATDDDKREAFIYLLENDLPLSLYIFRTVLKNIIKKRVKTGNDKIK